LKQGGVCSADHPDTLDSILHLARLREKQGKHLEAENLLKNVVNAETRTRARTTRNPGRQAYPWHRV